MLTWIIQISIISFIFIFLVHHLIGFFKTTLTVPKIKDLVNSPSQKYKHIFDTINTNTNSYTNINTNTNTNSNSNSYTAIDLLPTSLNSTSELDLSTKDTMKDELKNFLKKQMNATTDTSSQNNWLNIS